MFSFGRLFYTHIITFQIAKYSFDKNVSSFQIIVFKQLIWASKRDQSLKIRTTDPLDVSTPVHSKGDQPWVFFGRNNAKAETPVLWPPHAKS